MMQAPDSVQGRGLLSPWLWAAFLLLLAFSPASTKMGGTNWLVMALAGLYFMFRGKVRARGQDLDDDILRASRVWLLACAAGLLIKMIGVLYWGDPIGTRHFDLRLFLGALSIHFFVARVNLADAARRQLLAALLVAAVAGFVVSHVHATYNVPTPSNRINWAGGLVMLSWVMLSATVCRRMTTAWHRAAVIGFLVFWLAILMSGARAAYLSLPWALMVGAVLLISRLGSSYLRQGRWLLVTVFAVASLGSIVTLMEPKAVQVPMNRIAIAIEQAEDALGWGEQRTQIVDTSVGARIYMWQRSLEVIKERPWLGYGREQRMAFVKEWGKEANSGIVESQTHLHSEYINGMVDHGILGLFSTLAYMVGLLAMAWVLKARHGLMALAVAGIAFTHVTMSITDANSQTNNYSVMMNLALMSIFFFRFGPVREGGDSRSGADVPQGHRSGGMPQ